uniref:Glycosyltransferase n=1 Tax=viral metagenome TaxID=1070528 RepID=A0A6C0KIH4_9ZZZZ
MTQIYNMAEYAMIALIALAIIILAYLWYSQYKESFDVEDPSSSAVVMSPPKNAVQKIPKIIIQTWKNNEIPAKYMPLIESIKQANPDYEYKYFTDDDIQSFMQLHYPQYYRTYMSLPIKIQKIDFFRYIAVYHYGGFYMDLDMNAMQNFDDLLSYDCVFPVDEIINNYMCMNPRYKPFCDQNHRYLLGQYAFAASPKHPFIKLLIDRIHQNILKYIYNKNDTELYVYKSTGPDYVTQLYIDYEDKDNILVLHNNKRQYFGDYARHNYFGSWKNNAMN